MRAAESLAQVRNERAATALKEALGDKKVGVRLVCARSLATLYSLPVDLPDFQYLLKRLASDDPVQRDIGIRGIRDLVDEPLFK